MTKTFDELLHEADIQEFVYETEIDDSAPPAQKRIQHAIKPTQEQIDAAPSRSGIKSFGRRIEVSIEDILSRGAEIASLATQEELIEKEERQENTEIGIMWTNASYRLSDAANFVGSPFAKAKVETITEEKVKQWLKQAAEIFDSINTDQQQTSTQVKKQEESKVEQAHIRGR